MSGNRIHKSRRCLTSIVVLMGMLFLSATHAAAVELVVVVHEGVPVKHLTAEEVRNVFLGKRAYWDSLRAFPVTYPDHAQVMKDFLALVIGLSANEYKSWWIKRIFRNGDVPPMRAATVADALRTIASSPGAIGFVYADDLKGVKGVRAVTRVQIQQD